MPTTCFAPFKAKAMQVVRVDTCGVAATGANNTVSTDGFISVEMTPVYEAGAEFLVKNANGDLCVNEKDPDRLKRLDLVINLCGIDPAAIELMLGARLITRSAVNVGNAFGEDPNTSGFSLELWNDLAGQACTGGTQEWFMWVLPFVQNAAFGKVTNDYAAQTFSITASTKPNVNFGAGPNGLWIPDMGDNEHFAYQSTTVAPPAVACGYAA